jgi:hypothetical protein
MRRPPASVLALAASIAGAAVCAPASAQAPVLFPSTPTDQLALPGVAGGAEITPEGDLYTGYGELAFWAGRRLEPLDERVRSLLDGRWPVVRAARDDGPVRYELEYFAGRARGHAAFFVRVLARNDSARRAPVRFATGWRWSGGRPSPDGNTFSSRFQRPRTPKYPGLYLQPGEPFSPTASYAFGKRGLLRDGRVVYLFARRPQGATRTLLLNPDSGPLTPSPGSVFGRAIYRVNLRPRASARLDFVVPATPPSADGSTYRALAAASPAAVRKTTLAYWRALTERAMRLQLPERVAENTYVASLVNAAMARYRLPNGDWVQAVNKLQYHAFWLRDAAAITWMLGLVGLDDEVTENLRFFLRWQRPDGLFIWRPGEYDAMGQALWSFGQHAQRGGGAAFAKEVLPAVTRAMAWLEAQRAGDGGLMPFTEVTDDEATKGRLSGDSLWAVAGAREAVAIARLAGDEALARRWSDQAAALASSVRRAALDAAARTPGGSLPPALDTPGGTDFGNLQLAFPTGVFAPDEAIVSATLERARARFREGLATYRFGSKPFLLHGPLGFRVWETELQRGQQRAVVQGLYDSLAHTTPTRGGFELSNGQGVGVNLTPNGWWAAEYATLLRNMLVREDGRDLVVLSAVPPGWLRGREPLLVRGAPTLHGRVDLTLRPFPGGARLVWRVRKMEPGTSLRWPVPAWVSQVRGAPLTPDGREILLDRASGSVRVRWTLAPARTDPGYERSLDAQRRRYGRAAG